jgi:hypothetical protein
MYLVNPDWDLILPRSPPQGGVQQRLMPKLIFQIWLIHAASGLTSPSYKMRLHVPTNKRPLERSRSESGSPL